MLLRLLPSTGRALLASIAALVLVTPILSLVMTIASGVLIGSVPGAVTGGFDSPAGRRLITAVAALGGSFVVYHTTMGLREVLAGISARRLDRRLKARIMDATLSPAGVAHVEDPEVLDLIAIARSDTAGVSPGTAASGIVLVAVDRLGVLPPVVLLATFRWWLPVAVGLPMLWMRFTVRRHVLNTLAVRFLEAPRIRRAQYFVDLALTPSAAKETRVFGLGDWLGGRFAAQALSAFQAVWQERASGRRKLFAPLLTVMAAQVAGYLLIIDAAFAGALSLSRLTILLTAMGGVSKIISFGNQDVQVEYGVATLPVIGKVERLMAARREAMAGASSAAGLPEHEVRFEGVCFHYPGSEHEIYNGLDLTLRAGESLAVVGVNGAGKTTLVKLLARLHEPTAGRITVDGIDLRELDADQWQRRVAAIFQDFTRYELSAAANVGFGALALADDHSALAAVAAQAGATSIIEGLPAGWDTVLSRRFTAGVDLSGGQWQRIALARALLAVRAGAGILVLDEPTANLDARAEAVLYDRFLEVTRGVTTVVISHRFSTVRRADRIVVLDGGRVVEDGTHDELVGGGGHYARMFSLQAARFLDDPEVAGG
jgi:ATP-binding cassette subfamily B protein